MSDVHERREPGTHRVAVSTLVEICGNVPGIPIFEAESIDVSPHGMHLKTAYLPDSGAPVVCRFENDGGEIVVEGVVAWRREGGRGGEFGVKFTALDSRSVDALRELCKSPGKEEAREGEAMGEPGARVRLHIDGLGSPMKARVRAGTAGKVQVGSNLEFLKVGRRLEIEDLDQGARRQAQIDGVSVLIDPSTRIPQLVVALRYDGAEDTTPSPVTAQAGSKGPEPAALRIPTANVTVSPAAIAKARPQMDSAGGAASSVQGSSRQDERTKSAAESPKEAELEDEPALRGRVATLAAGAEVHAKAAGEKLASASAAAARGALYWFKVASSRVGELNGKRAGAVRRTTSPPPASTFPSEKPKLRAQAGAGAAPPAERKGPGRRLTPRVTVAIGAFTLAGIAGAFALSSPRGAPPGASAEGVSSAVAATGAAPNPGAAGPARDASGAVTAHVPLFGPTALTTTEPAPLGPPPSLDSEEGRELAEAKSALRSSAEDDQEWPDSTGERRTEEKKSPEKSKESEKPKTRPEDVAPWGRGRMNLPTIHRLRLDGPAGALQGAAEPTGFTVMVPGRKVMEAAAGIAKRDDRIARVRANNTAAGAQVSFRFKDGIPSYRVRLRRDYIEFLVSAPEKSSEKSKSSKAR